MDLYSVMCLKVLFKIVWEIKTSFVLIPSKTLIYNYRRNHVLQLFSCRKKGYQLRY